MITFKSFKVSDQLDEMNEFMNTHPPLPTDKGMAITFQDGYAIMWYEDGVFNNYAFTKSALTHAISEAKANLIGKRIALATAEDELYQLIPKEEYENKSGSELVVYFSRKTGLLPKQADEMAKLAAELDQKRWLSEKEIFRMTNIMIPKLEQLLAKNESKKK